MAKILSIDLGKFKSAVCIMTKGDLNTKFRTVKSNILSFGKKFLLTASAMAAFFAIYTTSSKAEEIDPFTYLQSTYNYTSFIADPAGGAWGDITGADAFDNGTKFGIIYDGGNVSLFEDGASTPYLSFSTGGSTGITEVDPAKYPGQIAVTDNTGIKFYDMDGNFKEMWGSPVSGITDITYDKERDRILLSTKHNGTVEWLSNTSYNSVAGGDPGAIEFIDLTENNTGTPIGDMLQGNRAFLRIGINGEVFGDSYSTNFGYSGHQGIAYTQNHAYAALSDIILIYDTLDFQPFIDYGFGENSDNPLIYLDFTNCSVPIGFGTVYEIAEHVKQYVSSRFAIEGVELRTRLQTLVTDPEQNSIVYFGGTDIDPYKLGQATVDPGNQNLCDKAYVYTDQALFTTLPANADEYKNMVANTAAHEIGHLLGYDHSDAAGMPFMGTGSAMESRIKQELQLGQLGEITQQHWTYIGDSDIIIDDNLNANNLNVIYANQETMTSEQFDEAVQEWNDYLEEQGMTASETVEFAVCSLSDVTTIFQIDLGIDDLLCLGIQNYNHPEYIDIPLTFGLLHVGNKDSSLDIANEDIYIAPVWNENLSMYVFDVNDIPEETLINGTLTASLFTPYENSERFDFYMFDPNYTVLSQKYIQFENVQKDGDINGDGKTNLVDFSVIADHYDEPCSYLDRADGADLNRDKYVDHQDLFILVENWLNTDGD